MRVAGFLLGLAVILFAGMIALANNQQDVTVIYFLGKSWSGRLWMALVAAFVAGGASMLVFTGFFIVRGRIRMGLLARKAARLEEEIQSMKQKPLPDERPVFPAEPAPAAGRRGMDPRAP